ncbi:Uncharacterised protein [Streptococcus pneumoniae]|nr:Uncharacterised protein [Streptococcus pneumoniae]CEW85719.1 Uncharacterised protein [Streptococcus pneumoniae]CEX64095.1 Uncharacterised protein [Streptococcus pneumoniae]CIT52809.1 Uncharacterised protein [Streptococcus pneumoniae]CJF42888.1 Uncharacterised protein [Streptococcus pneumoniae]
MTYTLEWLKTFDGEIDILNVKMDCLAILLRKMFLSTNIFIRQIWRTVLKLFYQYQIPPFLIF